MTFGERICALRKEKKMTQEAPADLPWVETEEDPEFMDYIRDFQQELRPEILEWLSQWKGRLTIFHNREEAEQYLEELKP